MTPPPKKLRMTHWSSQLLAAHLRTDRSSVLRTWRHHGLQPWHSQTFEFAPDLELVAKVTGVVALYMAPPENAIVLPVDRKSQILALDRTQKMQPWMPERRNDGYIRHGTSTLFAAIDIATGKVTGAVKPRHRHQEFFVFFKQVARAYPSTGDWQQLHQVMDNYATHKKVERRDRLADNPRILIHFTPTSRWWLNLVEVFVWTKPAEQTVTEAIRKTTSDSAQYPTESVDLKAGDL